MNKKLSLILSLLIVMILAVPALVRAEDETVSSKVAVKFYGFISAQTMAATEQLNSFGANLTPTGPNRVADPTLVANGDAFLSFTVQNSRFGFEMTPYDFGGKNFAIDARIEMDFWAAAQANNSAFYPRIRRAYTSIGNEAWNVLFGQEWDLFAPLNPNTLNSGAAMWQQGNVGFRRPQIRFTYNFAAGDEGGVEFAASIGTPNNATNVFNDSGNTTVWPLAQGRFGYWNNWENGKFKLYLSGLFGRNNNAVAGGAKINNWGAALSFDVPAHKYFLLQAEAHYGSSMNSVLSLSAANAKQATYGFWGSIQSKWLDWFETNIGMGGEFLKDSEVAAAAIKNNMNGYANLKFKPVTDFVIGVQYDYLRTSYDTNGNNTGHMGMLNTMYFF